MAFLVAGFVLFVKQIAMDDHRGKEYILTQCLQLYLVHFVRIDLFVVDEICYLFHLVPLNMGKYAVN